MGFRVRRRRTSSFRGAAAVMPSSICCDLDATDGTSTGTANEWLNKVSSPADGSNQTDWDFFLGTSGVGDGAEPTLTGSGDAQYFNFDGDDFLTQQGTAGATGTMTDDWHKTTGAPACTVVWGIRPVIDSNQAWVGNTNSFVNHGCRIHMQSDEAMVFRQDNGSVTYSEPVVPAATITATDSILGIGWNSSSTGSEQWWFDSSTGNNWDVSYSPNTDTTDANLNTQVGATVSLIWASGTRLYRFLTFNEILSDAQMADVITILNADHDALSV